METVLLLTSEKRYIFSLYSTLRSVSNWNFQYNVIFILIKTKINTLNSTVISRKKNNYLHELCFKTQVTFKVSQLESQGFYWILPWRWASRRTPCGASCTTARWRCRNFVFFAWRILPSLFLTNITFTTGLNRASALLAVKWFTRFYCRWKSHAPTGILWAAVLLVIVIGWWSLN